MCMVSLVLSHGQKIPDYEWTKVKLEKYKEAIEVVRELDEELGQPDCDNENKLAWLEDLEKRVNEREST